MTQIKTKIPAELEPAAVGGMVTDSKYVKDRVKNKTQEEVNTDTEERVSTLEESVGTGGSVDERIAVEKNRAEQAEGVLDGKVATEKQRAEGVEGGLNTRLQTVEQLAEISVGGGDIGIGTAADFESDDPEDLAKVPTVGAMLGGANDGVYDISARHSGTKYADLAAALGVDGANVPVGVRKGGMSVKYVQSSDNNYIQARLMANSFTTDVTQWQGVDDKPTFGSNNLVKSGGVATEIDTAIRKDVVFNIPTQNTISYKDLPYNATANKSLYMYIKTSQPMLQTRATVSLCNSSNTVVSPEVDFGDRDLSVGYGFVLTPTSNASKLKFWNGNNSEVVVNIDVTFTVCYPLSDLYKYMEDIDSKIAEDKSNIATLYQRSLPFIFTAPKGVTQHNVFLEADKSVNFKTNIVGNPSNTIVIGITDIESGIDILNKSLQEEGETNYRLPISSSKIYRCWTYIPYDSGDIEVTTSISQNTTIVDDLSSSEQNIAALSANMGKVLNEKIVYNTLGKETEYVRVSITNISTNGFTKLPTKRIGLEAGYNYFALIDFATIPSTGNMSISLMNPNDESDTIVLWEKSRGDQNNKAIQFTTDSIHTQLAIWIQDIGSAPNLNFNYVKVENNGYQPTDIGVLSNNISIYNYPIFSKGTSTKKTENISLKKGNYIVSYTINSDTPNTHTFGISDANDQSISSGSITGMGTETIKLTIEEDGIYILWEYRYALSNAVSSFKIEHEYGNALSTIYVAASDSTDTDKQIADFVCDGLNDEEEINDAIKLLPQTGTVVLLAGNYYVDKFKEYSGYKKTAIAITDTFNSRGVTIKGISHYHNATNIHVRETAFNDVTENDYPCVINVLSPNNRFWRVDIQDMAIALPNWSHKAIIINLEKAGCGEIKNLKLSTFGDYTFEHPENQPEGFVNTNVAEGIVGIRGFSGWTYGDTVRMDNISVWGCWRGFQLGGEHLIVNCCRGRFNYCAFTFGEYYQDVNFGAFDHPITLINCCDEQSYQGPIFVYNGLLTNDYDHTQDRKLQAITFIDFNTEQFSSLAYEVDPGTFCGVVMYHPSDGTYGAYTNARFWANGSGHNFKTINLTHARGGTTALRNTYAPNYMQEYYDTDLHKMLVYDGTNWRDYAGNIVN